VKRAFINGGPFDDKLLDNILFGKPSRRWEVDSYTDLPASYATKSRYRVHRNQPQQDRVKGLGWWEMAQYRVHCARYFHYL
jgi:hypothetical protein